MAGFARPGGGETAGDPPGAVSLGQAPRLAILTGRVVGYHHVGSGWGAGAGSGAPQRVWGGEIERLTKYGNEDYHFRQLLGSTSTSGTHLRRSGGLQLMLFQMV